MAPKRAAEGAAASSADAQQQKKPRKGFRVGPDNLPEGPWRRKGEWPLPFPLAVGKEQVIASHILTRARL